MRRKKSKEKINNEIENTIDVEEEVINDEEIEEIEEVEDDEEIIDEDDDEIIDDDEEIIDDEEDEEIEEDEKLNTCREIDFSNKDEVSQDFFDEKKKSKFVIFLIVLVVLSLIGCCCYFIYINKDKIFNKIDDVVDNMDGLVDVDSNDEENNDSNKSDVSTSGDEVEEKVLNVYQKDSDSVVVFTYKCKKSNCDIVVTKDSFILFDEDKVYRRDMSSYELDQVNNVEKTPTKSELSFNGFEEVKSVYDENSSEFSDEDKKIIVPFVNKLYIIENELYKFGDINNDIEKFDLIDDEVLFCRGDIGFLYNYKEKKIISFGEQGYSDYKKIDDFYLILYHEGDGSEHYEVYNNLEKIEFISFSDGYHIDNNKLYYLSYDENNGEKIVKIINSKNEKFDYNNEGIKPIHIFDGKLMYSDKDNVLCIKNILNNELIYKSEVKVKNGMIIEYNDGFKIFESDHSVIDEVDFEEFIKNENIDNEKYNLIKKCVLNDENCNDDVGYIINLDKDGKFLSKEYHIIYY